MKEFLIDLIKRASSRKFLLAVVGIIMAFGVNLTGAQISAITALIIAFTAAEGVADYATRIKDTQ